MIDPIPCLVVRRRLGGHPGRRLENGERSPEIADHLASCPACARFARDLELAHEELGRPASTPVPGPDFAARVLEEISGHRPGTAETLGWAALRTLPAALALLAALGWLSLRPPTPLTPPVPAPELLLTERPSDDTLFNWMMLGEGPETGTPAGAGGGVSRAGDSEGTP